MGRNGSFWVIQFTPAFKASLSRVGKCLHVIVARLMREELMRCMIVSLLILIIATPVALAADAEQERLAKSAEAMEEILNITDGLPREMLNKAVCVVDMPAVNEFAI